MAVAQLIERSLPTPKVRGLNPDIGKILSTNSTIEKTKVKKPENGEKRSQQSFTSLDKWLHNPVISDSNLRTSGG